MATAITHAQSSAKKWGGRPEDYLPIHEWFDETKAHVGDFRHRALRHHAFGVVQCVERFGPLVSVTVVCPSCSGARSAPCARCGGLGTSVKTIPTRWVAEQHLVEDFGRIPILADWLRCIQPEPWMVRGARKLHEELERVS